MKIKGILRFAGSYIGHVGSKIPRVGQSQLFQLKDSPPFAFPFPEPFVLGPIYTFIIIKPSMKQEAKYTNA